MYLSFLKYSTIFTRWGSQQKLSLACVPLQVAGFPSVGSWRCNSSSFMGLFYCCDPPCQMLSNAKESRFACLGFPSLNFDYPSFDFFAQNRKKIELPLEPWKGSATQSSDLPWSSVPSSQGGQTLSSRSRLLWGAPAEGCYGRVLPHRLLLCRAT